MKFDELGIHAPILKALTEAGYVAPTPIQEKAVPPVLSGRDLLGCAQTGTGKTAAFSLPILQRLSTEKGEGIRALILTPTRELALQIYENICQYARYTSCTAAVVFGGVSQIPQVEAIQRGADILIATPGRLWDLMGQKLVSLSHVECFVLDEADRMLDMGFINDVKKIVQFIPQNRQTLLFSATMPREIAALAGSLLKKPVRIAIKPASTPVELIEQKVFFAERPEKRELLRNLLLSMNQPQTLVFTRTKHGADRVARELNRAGISARSLHGDKSQGARQAALRDFKNYKIVALVATDIAARGLDISELPLVVNFELPNIPETYVHRIGRTGRAGQEGMAVSFCDPSELPYLADIEKLTRQKIPTAEPPAVQPSAVSDRQPPAARRSQPETAQPAVPEAPRGARRRPAARVPETVRSDAPETAPPRSRRRPAARTTASALPAVPEVPQGRRPRRSATSSGEMPRRRTAAVPEVSEASRRRTAAVPDVPEAPRRRTASAPEVSEAPRRRTASAPDVPEAPRSRSVRMPASSKAAPKNNRLRAGNHSSAVPSKGQRPRRGRGERTEDNTRVDIATPVNPNHISAEAAARIRAKVEAKLAERAHAHRTGSAPVPPKPAAHRPPRGRKR